MYFDVVSVICGTALVVVLAAIILRFSPEVTLRLWRYRPDDRSSRARAIEDQDGIRAPWTLWTPPEADATGTTNRRPSRPMTTLGRAGRRRASDGRGGVDDGPRSVQP